MLPRLESGGARQLRDGVQGGRLSRAYVPGPLTSTSHGVLDGGCAACKRGEAAGLRGRRIVTVVTPPPPPTTTEVNDLRSQRATGPKSRPRQPRAAASVELVPGSGGSRAPTVHRGRRWPADSARATASSAR